MKYVYLLSFYGEHGAEDVKATLDRGQLHALIDSYTLRRELDYHSALDEELKHSDEVLAAVDKYCDNTESQGSMPHNLSDGWGGMQLHVVKLES